MHVPISNIHAMIIVARDIMVNVIIAIVIKHYIVKLPHIMFAFNVINANKLGSK